MKRRRILSLFLLLLFLAPLQPAVPTLERSEAWIGQVRRGDLVHQVRGTVTSLPLCAQGPNLSLKPTFNSPNRPSYSTVKG
ncbi:hypothetical protein [Anthocerotibacter panamensis]|uniref:hypothetical protein n=1 Tax=Anthocerotibacter panamensis TaxID=2857077 RepID=UPI001C402423|nr:hypothetical protein [Anthocerotibacter panamensis]